MKKIILSVAVLMTAMLNNTFGQDKTTEETSSYEKRKLKVEEVNFVSSYYGQEGNNSAVTGGIGTEKLRDFANSIDLKLTKYDSKNRLHTVNIDLNVDFYTSASSDNIDPLTVSSASRKDTHFYPTISWSMKNDVNRTTKGLSVSYSTEYDYKSYGFNLSFAKASKDNNREFSVKGGAFFDTWSIILPPELRPNNYGSGAHGDRDPIDYRPRNSYNLAFSLSQIINKRLQVLVTAEPAYQEGLLSTPFHRIYFKDGSESVERLPGSRMKLPVGMRLSYFLGDRTILRAFYRYYMDDWGMKANTMNLEATVKLNPYVSLSPFYRYNTQTAVKYFNPYGKNDINSAYYTSDYDISGFNSTFIGSGVRFVPANGILGIKEWNSLELRYGHYTRTTGMTSNIVTMLVKFK
ncbi:MULTISPECIES: DUF3570 domain-containing protein [unclassified Arcicella]|uniref:DUF3570 domain-containing protein n=1 Tax=unclassified Arcicella TaxID=2644986 RepID=UPI00286546E1|nr:MULTISPECIES: DUF3570 domain-containing protein [unclassified Arcicella]MDR6564065.1 hypothetical protein [Arcicella sp. BE51]MDR6813818.1 hypothetical protein [Arcicella sp. BE140]MDR6825130.1 hypothetical protein [Arcicella sp. BE139]